MANGRQKIISGEADGATSVGIVLDTSASYTTAGSKLLSIQNAGVEKFSIDKDGNVALGGLGTWQTFTPTLVLTGGSGNVVPQYATTQAYYLTLGNTCFVKVYLSGDGGNEGAGTGAMSLTLPVTAAAEQPEHVFYVGLGYNDPNAYHLLGQILASAPGAMDLKYFSAIFTLSNWSGPVQNNPVRSMSFDFSYLIG